MFVVESWNIAVNLDGNPSNSVLSFLTRPFTFSKSFIERNRSCLVAFKHTVYLKQMKDKKKQPRYV